MGAGGVGGARGLRPEARSRGPGAVHARVQRHAEHEGVARHDRARAGRRPGLLALWLYGKIGRGAAPEWVGPDAPPRRHAHVPREPARRVPLPLVARLRGRRGQTRRFVHSLLGCAFYGAFTVKVLCVRSSPHARLGAARWSAAWCSRCSSGCGSPARCGSSRTAASRASEGTHGRLKRSSGSCRCSRCWPRCRSSSCCSSTSRPSRRRSRRRAPPTPAASIYATRCASCHGADGGGGFGPPLGGGIVVERYPNPADQIAVVTNGRGSMPSFAGSLTPEQIAAVVEFTRTGLG